MNGIQYTCPDHSQIKQSEPGLCSVCGRPLEPMILAEIQD